MSSVAQHQISVAPDRLIIGEPTARNATNSERAVDICERLMDIAAALFNVSGRELRCPSRNSSSAARVRQVAMYVAHVIFGLTMADVGNGFGRDRTTVRHACHLVEDLRDDEEFDQIVAMMEKVSMAALKEWLR